jgi:hypothetical protein
VGYDDLVITALAEQHTRSLGDDAGNAVIVSFIARLNPIGVNRIDHDQNPRRELRHGRYPFRDVLVLRSDVAVDSHVTRDVKLGGWVDRADSDIAAIRQGELRNVRAAPHHPLAEGKSPTGVIGVIEQRARIRSPESALEASRQASGHDRESFPWVGRADAHVSAIEDCKLRHVGAIAGATLADGEAPPRIVRLVEEAGCIGRDQRALEARGERVGLNGEAFRRRRGTHADVP